MGFLAVLSSVRGFQIIGTAPGEAAIYFNYAAKGIGLAILFDTLDGRLARLTKTSTQLGVQLDSLADVLTFGIAPVVLAYCWGVGAALNESDPIHNIGLFALFLYLICGVLRLARFNIQATRPRVLMEGSSKVDKRNFVGLPIPPSAGLIAAIIHFAPAPLSTLGTVPSRFYAIAMIVLIAILGLLMVSTLKYTSFKNVGSGRRNFYLVLVLGTIGMLIWLYSRYVLLAMAVAYTSHGVIWYLMGLVRSGSRSKAGAGAR